MRSKWRSVDAQGQQGGFSLLELLIVVVVLGVLAGIVIAAIGSTRHDAVANTCREDASAIQLSAETVNLKTGSFPTDADASTSPNPLLASYTPANGAMLKGFPTSDKYVLRWDGTAHQVDVYQPDGATMAGVGAAGCKALS